MENFPKHWYWSDLLEESLFIYSCPLLDVSLCVIFSVWVSKGIVQTGRHLLLLSCACAWNESNKSKQWHQYVCLKGHFCRHYASSGVENRCGPRIVDFTHCSNRLWAIISSVMIASKEIVGKIREQLATGSHLSSDFDDLNSDKKWHEVCWSLPIANIQSTKWAKTWESRNGVL